MYFIADIYFAEIISLLQSRARRRVFMFIAEDTQ